MSPKELGTAIRETRRKLGLRQDLLAAAANVGVRFIVDLEAGKSTAQVGKTLGVLNALGIKISLIDTAPGERGQ